MGRNRQSVTMGVKMIIGIIIFISLTYWIGFGMGNEQKRTPVSTTIPALIVISFMSGAFYLLIDKSYQDGQVDAINGVIKYELVTQPDSTRIWEKIK